MADELRDVQRQINQKTDEVGSKDIILQNFLVIHLFMFFKNSLKILLCTTTTLSLSIAQEEWLACAKRYVNI